MKVIIRNQARAAAPGKYFQKCVIIFEIFEDKCFKFSRNTVALATQHVNAPPP